MDWSGQTLLHTIGFAQGWPQWFAASGIQRKMQATDLEFDSAQLCLEAAALGHGIALGRSSFVEDYLDNKRLVALPQPDLEAKDQVYLTIALGLSQQAPAALFRDHLLGKMPTTKEKPRFPLGERGSSNAKGDSLQRVSGGAGGI